MKSMKFLQPLALLLLGTFLLNSCGVSVDISKRQHQPGFYVNVSNDRPANNQTESETEDAGVEMTEREQVAVADHKNQNRQFINGKSPKEKKSLQIIRSSKVASAAYVNTSGKEQKAKPEKASENLWVSTNPVQAAIANNFFPVISQQYNAIATSSGGSGGKSQIVALLLVIFLGGLGIHRFYLGYTGIGIVQLLMALIGTILIFVLIGYFILLGLYIWLIIDLIRIITGDLQPKGGRYSQTF